MQAVLEQHRAKSKICPRKLAHLVYRGKDRFERVQTALAEFKKHGAVPHPGLPELSRVEIFAHAEKIVGFLRSNTNLNVFDEDNPLEECFLAMNFHSPGSIGAVMTTNIVRWMGSQDQVTAWLPKLQNNVYLACYAQTELGTGSDVQNLQTMAVFDPKTQEFVFHSPTTASIKWWPGDLGISCSHGAVFARLISNGKDHGVQAFFVELRDPKTHIPHKGVEVGDIGPKLGYNSKDNGFLKFTQYRASKNCLLSRYITIDDEGNVTKRGNPRQMYSGMMRTRTALLTMSTNPLSKACTIAFRYSLFRTQFTDKHGQPMRIYDYQQQRTKLFHALSQVYMMNLSQAIALKHIEENNLRAEKDDFSMLQSTHIMLCCLKPMFTEWSAKRIEDLMKCCGGHGFSNYSGLPLHFKETFPNQILEGENSVLLLQVTRFLLKSFARLHSKKNPNVKLPEMVAFLADYQKFVSESAEVIAVESFLLPSVILNRFRKAVTILTVRTASFMASLPAKTDGRHVWDTQLGVSNQRVARLFAVLLILDAAQQRIQAIPAGLLKSKMEKLWTLFASKQVEELAALMLLSGCISQAELNHALEQGEQIVHELADDGLKLAEGWQWGDKWLDSAIALQKDNPYDNLYKWAKEYGTLNRFENQIHPAVQEHQLKVSRLREQRL